MTDTNGGAKPKVPQEKETRGLQQDTFYDGKTRETEDVPTIWHRQSPQTTNIGQFSKPSDEMRRQEKQLLPYNCDINTLSSKQNHHLLRDQVACRVADKPVTSEIPDVCIKGYDSNIRVYSPTDCNRNLEPTFINDAKLTGSDAAVIDKPYSASTLEPEKTYEQKFTVFPESSFQSLHFLNKNLASNDCEMDKPDAKLQDTEETDLLFSSSSSSLESNWLQNSTAANENDRYCQNECDCSTAHAYKCNCDSDWTFRLPGLYDADSDRKSVDITQAPPDNERNGKQRKLKRDRECLGCADRGDEHTETSTDDNQYELVFDDYYGEVVRRAKSNEKPGPMKNAAVYADRGHNSGTDSTVMRNRKTDTTSGSSDCTYKHALPYLPERLRDKLTASQNDHTSTKPQVSAASPSHTSSPSYAKGSNSVKFFKHNHSSKTYSDSGKDTQVYMQGTDTEAQPARAINNRGHLGTRPLAGQTSCKCNAHWNDNQRLRSRDTDTGFLKWIDDDLKTFEDSIEDPFRVKDGGYDVSDQFTDLIDHVNEPLIDLSDDDELTVSNRNIGRRLCTSDLGNNQRGSSSRQFDSPVDSPEMLEGPSRYNFREVEGDSERMADLNRRHGDKEAMKDCVRDHESLDNQDTNVRENVTASASSQRVIIPDETSPVPSISDSTGRSCCTTGDCAACTSRQQQQEEAESDGNVFDLLEERMFSFEEDLLDLDNLIGLREDEDESSAAAVRIVGPASAFLEARFDSSLRQIRRIQLVIQQMLALHPDLLGSPTTPAAPQSVIDELPEVNMTTEAIEQHPSCPICLCPCESGDRMCQLPCQHVFHPTCVRAWLQKSGTCPVCRQKLDK